jgi:hypothetical protein
MTSRKRTNNDLQNITHNSNDRATRISLNNWDGLIGEYKSTFNSKVKMDLHEPTIIKSTSNHLHMHTPGVSQIKWTSKSTMIVI